MKRIKRLFILMSSLLLCGSLMSIQKSSTENKDKKRDYMVTVTTNSQTFSGTDGKVYIILFGTTGKTNAISLDNNDKNNFETGETDEFHLVINDIGDIEAFQLIVEPDGDTWALYRVAIDHWSYAVNQTYEIDTMTEKFVMQHTQYEYKLEMQCSALEDSGTYCDIYILLYSGNDYYAYQKLDNNGSDFDDGSYGVYYVVGLYAEIDRVHIESRDGCDLKLSWAKVDGVEYYNGDKAMDPNNYVSYTHYTAYFMDIVKAPFVTYNVRLNVSDNFLAGTDEDILFNVTSNSNVDKYYYFETGDDIDRGDNVDYTFYNSTEFGEVSKFGILINGDDDIQLDSIEFNGTRYNLDEKVLNTDDGWYTFNVDNSGNTEVNVGTSLIVVTNATWSIITTVAIVEVAVAVFMVVYFMKKKKDNKDTNKDTKDEKK